MTTSAVYHSRDVMSTITSRPAYVDFWKGCSMQISMKCSVAVHCLIFIHEAKGIVKVTSNLLAESTGCNPVIIRNIPQCFEKSRVHYNTAGNRWCRIMCRSIPNYSLSNLHGVGTEWTGLADRNSFLPGPSMSGSSKHWRGFTNSLS